MQARGLQMFVRMRAPILFAAGLTLLVTTSCGSVSRSRDGGSAGGAAGSSNGAGGTAGGGAANDGSAGESGGAGGASDGGARNDGAAPTMTVVGGIESVGPTPAGPVQVTRASLAAARTRVCSMTICVNGGITP